MTSDFVLGFINSKAGNRIGLRVYSLTTEHVSEIYVPENSQFLNLYIRKGRLTPQACTLADFPVYTSAYDTLGSCIPGVKGANAWVLSKYTDGRLKVVSVTGQIKTVTYDTALVFHKQYGIVGCQVSQDGTLVPPTYDYVHLQVSTEDVTLDKDAARAILAFRYDLGTNMGLVLFDACKTGDLELVKLLVASELIDIHANADNALRLASENGHKDIVKLLLAKGADVHASNDYALRWSSKFGHKEVVKLLLGRGADIHANHDNALRYSSENGHIEVVRLLLGRGANRHANHDAALRAAREKGHKDIIKLLTNS